MRILVVDDEDGVRKLLIRILTEEGHEVLTASDGVEAIELLDNLYVDLVLSDVRMPRMDGLELLRQYAGRPGSAPLVIMSAYGDDDAAVEAIRHGAADYLSKPFRVEHVLLVLRKALERDRLRVSVRRLSEELSLVRGDEDVIGRSAAFRHVIALAYKAAPHPSSVMLTGESGTGKEMIARLIHRASPRFQRPFLLVCCRDVAEDLLELQLFGATDDSAGAAGGNGAMNARGGTVFLEDVDALSNKLQLRLLAALRKSQSDQNSDNEGTHDVRVISTTGTNPDQLVASGRFRPDLFYALSVVRLHLPPLRERMEDVEDLALYFAGSHARKLQRSVPRITPAALRALSDHPWPGNVPELENAVERALVMGANDEIRLEHVEAVLATDSGEPNAAKTHEDLSIKRQTAALERRLIAIALDRTHGNKSRAARLLDLSHRALLYKIREYKLDD